MKRKVLVVLFFIVVFGLPVAWYLFLQTFGENQFALPRLEKWDQTCLEIDTPTLVISAGAFDEYPNQRKRLETKLQSQNLISFRYVSGCKLNYDLYLVGEEGWVRSQLVISREEIDRLLAEMDIYVLNNQDESDKGQ